MRRRVLAIALSLVLALLGAVGVVTYAQASDARAVAGQQLTSVYITSQVVPKGTSVQAALDAGLMKAESVVAKGAPEGAMVPAAAGNGPLVALADVAAGGIVLKARFGNAADLTTDRSVPAGKVAVTVKLEDPQRAAPLLTPGSHIVIYDTFNPVNAKAATLLPDGAKLQEKPEKLRATRVVLSDVVVLAVGSTTAASPASTADAEAQPQSQEAAALVTVAVSPEDAIVLVHAVQTGTLYAALRGPATTVDPKAAVTDTTVLTGR